MKPSKSDLVRDLKNLAEELDDSAVQAEIRGDIGVYRGIKHSKERVEEVIERHE